MGKRPSIGKRIRALREARHDTQAELAKCLGVTQGAISAWERDDKERAPSAEAFFRLANLAENPEDKVLFLGKAGIAPETITSAARKIAKDFVEDHIERAKVLKDKGDVILIRRYRETAQGIEKAGPRVPLPTEFIPNPDSTCCFVVDELASGVIDAPRGLLVVDTSVEGTENLHDLLSRVILLWYKPLYEFERRPQGIYAGRLGIQAGALRKGDTVELVHHWSLQFLTSAAGLSMMSFLNLGTHSGILPFDFSKTPEKTNFSVVDLLDFVRGSEQRERMLSETRDRMLSEFRMVKGNKVIGQVIGRLSGNVK
jgi:transcriptional regulator with XRE-family HTH domain